MPSRIFARVASMVTSPEVSPDVSASKRRLVGEPARIGAEAGVRDKRNFTDWYAPDVGLVTPLVSTDGQKGCQMARIGMLRFAKSATAHGSCCPNGRPISSSVITQTAVMAVAHTDKQGFGKF
jgi:hypothetical protein